MISDEYAAGFLDGEGCIRAYVRQPRPGNGVSVSHRATVQIGNLHRGVLEQFQERWGGSVRPKKGKPGYRQVWVWNASGKAAKRVLEDLLPHLIVKRKQAQIALELMNRMWSNPFIYKLEPEEIEAREELRLALVAEKQQEYSDDSGEIV